MNSTLSGFIRILIPAMLVVLGSGAVHAQPAPVTSPAPVVAPSVIAPPAAPVLTAKPFAGIILNKDQQQAALENNFYVIPDTEKNLSVRLITERIITGAFAKNAATSPVVNLKYTGTTTWLVLPITNVSASDVWELDFGDSASGRQSFLDRITVFNSFNNKTVFNSNPPQDEPKYSIPNKLRLNIPTGQSGFIIIETRNPSGLLSILNLSLKPAYFADTSKTLGRTIMGHIPLIVAVILFSALLLQHRPAYAAFGISWLLIYLHDYLIDNYIFVSGFSADILTPAIWLLVSVFLIIGFWLSDDDDNRLPASLFIGLSFLCLVCGLISLLISDFVPMMGSILSYGPLVISNLVLIIMGWLTMSRTGDRSYIFLSLSGIFLIAVMGTLATASFMSLPLAELLLSASHIALCLSGLSIAAFTLVRQSVSSHAVARPQDMGLPSQQSQDLAGAKENSEHKRLLQVLDQERAMMAEMQVQEARRTEEMRKAKEAADEANTAKSAFLAVVSHEIRTPMTGIMGMVRLMLDTALSKDQKEYANTIQDSGEALMALLNDILDFEKIESGKLELERADFDLHRLLRGIQTLMNGHANSKGVELKLELDPKLPTFVVGDSTRLRQILLNLVNNAIKFTSKGAVYIRINDLTPDDKLQGPHQIYFAVQDSGIGISPEVQKKLFMPFAQADSSTARKYGGTGLGLAICKRLIEVMGGAINISSKPNEGATFFFTLSLPLGQGTGVLGSFSGAASASGPVDSQPFQKTEIRHLHILVVDDNGINQKVLSGLIEKDGHTVVTASTGAEALGKYLASAYDLVLMDIELPDRSGIEVTSDIRNLREPDKASVPIVAMTGNTSDKDVAACFNAGMDDFLAKPINPDRLKTILKIASGNGHFANHVQKQARDQNTAPAPAVTVVPDVATLSENTYVPMPPPAPGTPFTKPTNTPPPAAVPEASPFSFDLDDLSEEDEDTFATAIRQFETIEAQTGTALDSDLDENMLGTLKNSLTVTQLEELLVSFYEKAEELVTAIGQSYLEKDLDALGARAHELKGMAGNFGFSGVSTLSAQIEKAAKTKNEPDLAVPVQRLAETYAVSKARLIAWLSQ